MPLFVRWLCLKERIEYSTASGLFQVRSQCGSREMISRVWWYCTAVVSLRSAIVQLYGRLLVWSTFLFLSRELQCCAWMDLQQHAQNTGKKTSSETRERREKGSILCEGWRNQSWSCSKNFFQPFYDASNVNFSFSAISSWFRSQASCGHIISDEPRSSNKKRSQVLYSLFDICYPSMERHNSERQRANEKSILKNNQPIIDCRSYKGERARYQLLIHFFQWEIDWFIGNR